MGISEKTNKLSETRINYPLGGEITRSPMEPVGAPSIWERRGGWGSFLLAIDLNKDTPELFLAPTTLPIRSLPLIPREIAVKFAFKDVVCFKNP